MFYAVLCALESYGLKDESVQFQAKFCMLGYVKSMVENSTEEQVSQWVRTFVVLPNDEREGKPKQSRIIYKLLGNIPIPVSNEEGIKLQEAVATERQAAHTTEYQETPTDFPHGWPLPNTKLVPVQDWLAQLFRAAGGQEAGQRAARGNQARQLAKGNKKR